MTPAYTIYLQSFEYKSTNKMMVIDWWVCTGRLIFDSLTEWTGIPSLWRSDDGTDEDELIADNPIFFDPRKLKAQA